MKPSTKQHLIKALRSNNLKRVGLLLTQVNDASDDIYEILLECQNSQSLKQIIPKTPNLNVCIKGENVLTHAITRGDRESVEFLLKQQLSADNLHKGLRKAAYLGNVSFTKILLNHTQIEHENESALFDAIKGSNLEIIKILMSAGANPYFANAEGNVLHHAIQCASLQVIDFFLQYDNQFLNSQNQMGATPLFLAAFKGNCELVMRLLKEQPELNISNRFSQTPLIVAATNGNLSVVKCLVEAGVDINQTADGLSSLMWALRNDHLGVAKYLLDNNCDIANAEFNKKTPLHFACDYGDYELVKKLLERETNIDLKDSEGRTVLEYADEIKTDERIIRLLKKSYSEGQPRPFNLFEKNKAKTQDGVNDSLIKPSNFLSTKHP